MGQMVLESISSGLQPDALPSKLLPRVSSATVTIRARKKPGVCDTGLRKGFRTRPRVTGADADWKKNRRQQRHSVPVQPIVL